MTPIVIGPLTLTQAAGAFTIAIDDSVALGGGAADGVISAQGQGAVVVKEVVIANLGLKALGSLFPALAPFLVGVQTEVDSLIAGI